MGPLELGLMLLLFGTAFYLLILFMLRAVPKLQVPLPASLPESSAAAIPVDVPTHSDAVFLVQPGGRVLYCNQRAREWFHLEREEPNLERLSRRAQPGELFLSLCAAEGQAHLSLDGRFLEASSYTIPYGAGRATLVRLRRPSLVIGAEHPDSNRAPGPTGQTQEILSGLSQSMTASLELERTLQTVLESVERVVSADFQEINLWDAGNGYLVPYRLAGRHGLDRRLEKGSERYRLQDGYAAYLSTQRKPLLISDTSSSQELRPPGGRARFSFRSYLGLPLAVSDELIGTLELASVSADAFSRDDLEILSLLSGPASAGLHHALLYQAAQRRSLEYSALARMAQAASPLHDPQELFSHLVGSLTSLLEVNILGFLLFEEERRTLEAQIPFHGLPDEVVAWYHSRIEPDSPASCLWQSAEMILTGEAASDPRLEALSLHHLAQAAGIHRTVLMPLTCAGHTLGYLQVADKRDGSAFGPQDLRLLATIAEQAAAIIEGSLLVQQALRANCREEAAPVSRKPETIEGAALAGYPPDLSADETRPASALSSQAGIAIQDAKLSPGPVSLAEDLERLVEERTSQLALEHRRTSVLLRLITELSSSLDLELVLDRTLRVLNEIVDAEQVAVLISHPGDSQLHHLASLGYASVPPSRGRTSPFQAGQGLAGWVIENRQPALIADVRQDPRWLSLPGNMLEHRSAIGVPLMAGSEALGALLFFHRQVGHFRDDQLDLIQAAANQVAIAVNNAELYRLIRDQAEDLGSMLRAQQVEASRSKAILEAVADGVLVTDAKKTITLFNASAEKILGLNRAEVIGESLEHFIGLSGRAARAWTETIEAWSQEPAAQHSGGLYAGQITLEDGRVISVNLAPVLMQEEPATASDFLGTVSTFRDITHQVEVNRLKSEFVATASHELRTPMTAIKGYVELLLMGVAGGLNEQQIRFLEIVRQNTGRLSNLVNDLLDISRIESGQAALSLQPLDLTGLVEETCAGLRRRSRQENKPLNVELALPAGLPPVCADPERVRQILENLLDNAYRYTAENGRISLQLRDAGSELQVDIQDTGIGIPAELQPRIFERFYRGQHPYVIATAGAGLGLSIVKNLVDMHHGRIWLQSSGIPGQGSTFSFTLPIWDC